MDAVTPLASQAAMLVAPFLPQLLRLGQGAAEEMQDQGWDLAKQLWNTLGPKVEAKPSAQEAAQEVAARPSDQDSIAALRVQLRKLLTEDTALKQDIENVIAAGERSGTISVTARGDRAVAMHGNMQGSGIITGDNSQVSR